MTIQLPLWLGPLVLSLVCASAFLEGEWEERLTAGGLFANVVLTLSLRDYSWPQVQQAGFLLDVAFLVFLIPIALRTAKLWPLMACSCQLLIVVTHVVKILDPGFGQWAYITAGVIWTYALMIAMSIGVWNCWKTQRYRAADARAEPATDTRR